MRVYIILICVLFFSSCGKKINDGGEYGGKVLVWFSKGFNGSLVPELNENTFYLYYNDRVTCETCKVKLFEIIKERNDLVILTSFDSATEVSFFKEAYKIDTEVINSTEFRNNSLIYPFLFQTEDGLLFRNIYVFNDENLNENSLNGYFNYVKRNRAVFY